MRRASPLVVLILGGAAERWGCPPAESPLALAKTPALDRLALEGRVFGVRLVATEREAASAAPLLAILGFDPRGVETARASYLGILQGESLELEECFVSADFCALFRDLVADVDPGPLRTNETEILLRAADVAMRRAGIRVIAGSGAHHVAVAPRASIDADVSPPEFLLGRPIDQFTPRVEQHAFAHRLARDVLERHEINEVRRDVGRNGADTIWLWGPGGVPALQPDFDGPVSALGAEICWRGLCKAADIPLRVPNARTPVGLLRGVRQALKSDRVCFLYAHRGVRDALVRQRKLRAEGLAEIDEHLIGPVAKAVAAVGGRLLVLPDAARDSDAGHVLADPVPALLWGEGIDSLLARPYTESAVAAAGEPIEPGHGLLAYVRNL